MKMEVYKDEAEAGSVFLLRWYLVPLEARQCCVKYLFMNTCLSSSAFRVVFSFYLCFLLIFQDLFSSFLPEYILIKVSETEKKTASVKFETFFCSGCRRCCKTIFILLCYFCAHCHLTFVSYLYGFTRLFHSKTTPLIVKCQSAVTLFGKKKEKIGLRTYLFLSSR